MAAQKDLDFGMKCIKYMLLVANLMFVLVGLLLISIGFTVKSIYKNFDSFMESYYYSPSVLAVIVGFIILIIALFGCIGAIKESTCLVNMYAFFLTCVLILEISIGIAAYSMRSNIETKIASNMEWAMERYDMDPYAYGWNATQYNLQCCGIYSFREWNKYANYPYYFPLTDITFSDNQTFWVPDTCCLEEKCSADTLYGSGCLNRLLYIVSQCALLLAVGALCVSSIQILGIAFAHMLAKSIRKLKTQMLVEREERRRHFYEQMTKNEIEKPKSPVLYTAKDSQP